VVFPRGTLGGRQLRAATVPEPVQSVGIRIP
jgi:hypothetical protein